MADQLVPLTALALSLGGWIVVVVFAIVFSYISKKKRYEAVVKAMELGKSPQEINELFNTQKPGKKTGMGYLVTAILLGALGISLLGLGIVTPQTPGNDIFPPAIFALVFSLAFASIYYIVRARAKKE